MKHILFIANTPYHIFLCTWLKYHYYNDEHCDIMIHNKLKGYLHIKENIEKTELFDNVLVVTYPYNKGKLTKVFKTIYLYFEAKSFAKNQYDSIYFPNTDFFTQRLFDFIRRKKQIVLNLYEDGMLTYSRKFEYFFNLFKKEGNKLSHDNFLVKYHMCDYITDFCVFSPEMLEWEAKAKRIFKIDTIDVEDSLFKDIVNTIFDYYSITDNYDKKYIFFEESFYHNYGYMEDVELVEKLASRLDKENIMVKIHPRNQLNRFKDLGYKTNHDTSIPWEVLALNMDLESKTLITIASSSIVNPVVMFNSRPKSYSLINCLRNKPNELNSDYSKTVVEFYKRFDNIKICNSLKEIQ